MSSSRHSGNDVCRSTTGISRLGNVLGSAWERRWLGGTVPLDHDEPPLLANGLPRPQPPPTVRERVESLTERLVIKARARRERTGDESRLGGTDRPVLITVLAAITAAISTVAAVWLWQSWATRSTPAIEDLLPRAEAGDIASAESATGESTVGALAAGDVDPAPQPVPAGGASAVLETAATASTGGDGDDVVAASIPTQLAVHIAGAVVEPGVVYLPAGARVVDAVIAGGGATRAAELDRLNLAVLLEDGQQIYVPVVGEEVPGTAANAESAEALSGPDESATPESVPARIDLNRATELELQGLPGIGPTMAAAIVGYRDSVGGFVGVDELVNVSGIGPTRLETLRPLVSVDGRID